MFDAKRLIGRKFADPIVQADIKLWPFKVKSGTGDKPMIVVQSQGEEKTFHPEEISSMILTKMKETAEAYLGTKVNDAGHCALTNQENCLESQYPSLSNLTTVSRSSSRPNM